jgi:RNA polymerase sigma factor (sigma-70 family)
MLIRVEPLYDDWIEHITRIDLERALQSLPPERRAVVELYLYEGKSITAIARLLRRPRREVEALLQHALETLRNALR